MLSRHMGSLALGGGKACKCIRLRKAFWRAGPAACRAFYAATQKCMCCMAFSWHQAHRLREVVMGSLAQSSMIILVS